VASFDKVNGKEAISLQRSANKWKRGEFSPADRWKLKADFS